MKLADLFPETNARVREARKKKAAEREKGEAEGIHMAEQPAAPAPAPAKGASALYDREHDRAQQRDSALERKYDPAHELKYNSEVTPKDGVPPSTPGTTLAARPRRLPLPDPRSRRSSMRGTTLRASKPTFTWA